MPVQALSSNFRANLRADLEKTELLAPVSPAVWQEGWVVHCQPAGRGEKVLDYVGRYFFPVAHPNARPKRNEDGQVTSRYRATTPPKGCAA